MEDEVAHAVELSGVFVCVSRPRLVPGREVRQLHAACRCQAVGATTVRGRQARIEGYSNIELADAFDVTEGRASQLRGGALDQMREQIGDTFLDAA